MANAVRDIFLQPGEYRVADRGCRLHTILGSCVSITLWHPTLCVGAMCHFLLGERPGTRPRELDPRYAEEATALMMTGLVRLGARAEECQAKLFGGGNMFPGHERTSEPSVGERNGATARRLMREHGIPIVSESLFGVGHRRIIFDVASGDVWSRQYRPGVTGIKEST